MFGVTRIVADNEYIRYVVYIQDEDGTQEVCVLSFPSLQAEKAYEATHEDAYISAQAYAEEMYA